MSSTSSWSGQSKDGSKTPRWLFDVLNEQVQALTGQAFELDAAASEWNAQCEDYLDEETDALQQDWSQWSTVFCNPPFSATIIERFVGKAHEAADQGSTVVLLLPSWPGYHWFQELKRRGQIQDIVGPVAFERPDGSKFVLNNGRNTTSLVVATLGPKVAPGTNGEPVRNPNRIDQGLSFNREGIMSTSNGGKKTKKRQVVKPPPFTLLSEIEPKNSEWLWPLRVPLGELTIIDGDPGTNKSSLTIDLAARVSTGRKMPDGTAGRRGGVLLLVAEDSVSKTLRLRLEAAGANLCKVAVLNELVTIPGGLSVIERSAFQVKAKLVVIDPVMVFLGRNANTDQAVRQALTPLKELAERTNAAVVLVRHLNKSGGRRSLYRGSGSIGIVAATRSALLVGNDPKDPNMRVLCHVKSNLGPLAPSLRFEPVKSDDGVVRVEWRGECDCTAEDLLVTSKNNGQALEKAQDFLMKLLAEGPVEQGMVKAKAAEATIAYRTVERAKEMLGVHSKRKGWGPGSKCFWKLPGPNGRT